MKEVRLELPFGRQVPGIDIITAMENVVGTRLVRSSKIHQNEVCFVIGCRDKNSQAGDAWIVVEGCTVISPVRLYRSLTIINHSWIEPMKGPWSGDYFKTPKRGQVVKALTKLQGRLKEELKIKL